MGKKESVKLVANARPIATRKNTAGMNIPTVALLDTIPPT